MQLSFQIISPEVKGTVADQAESCIDQLQEYLNYNDLSVTTLTVFINSDKNILLEQKRIIFEHTFEDIFNQRVPMAFIAEPCVKGLDFLVEVHAFKNTKTDYTLRYKDDDDFVYTLIEGKNKDKFLFVAGISKYYKNDNVVQSSKDAFKQMCSILNYERMDLSNIYRQWNYIEGIIETNDEKGFLTQNYQDFNDVRAKYYNKYDFTNGYPAATGIGTIAGGLNISFYAYSGKDNAIIKSVINPLQTEAFDYSEQVLVGNKSTSNYCKAAPKFDRAKYFGLPNNEYIFISGTAAIRGEETLAIGDASEQTRITIENMLELIKQKSLQTTPTESTVTEFKLLYIKVYVKNKADQKQIEDVCNQFFPLIPKAYVLADVCRDNLLVEIEGIAEAFN